VRTIDAVRLDPRARRVTVEGTVVDLTAKEFDL
jgi:DNA-binding response OmpR family regulator